VFVPAAALDYELEAALWVGEGNALGHPIPVSDAGRRVVGLGLLNDWSARDMQRWEYQPLGPFLAKSFMTSVSPWIVTVEALAPFRCAQPPRPAGDPQPLPYLSDEADQAHGAYDVELEALLTTPAMRRAGAAPHGLSRASMLDLYWTAAQMVAHHTSNGCSLNPGDLLGTGTISADRDDGAGCLLELTRAGKRLVRLPSGETRAYLQDGDQVVMRGRCRRKGFAAIGFGELIGEVLAADPCASSTVDSRG
jgi:fumarylacetoacetase